MTTKTLPTDAPTADTVEDVFLLLAAEAAGLKESRLWRVDLDRDNRVLGRELIMERGADTLVIHPRRVFRGALSAGAAKVILVHNLCDEPHKLCYV